MDDDQPTTTRFREKGEDMTTKQTNRRALLTGAAAVAAGGSVLSKLSKGADAPAQKKVYRSGPKPATPPPFSTAVSLGNLLFISGILCRTPGDIKAHTEFVLGDLKRQLEAAGSSMDKVLRCTVFLADIKDFAVMNEVYTGKFGDDPPAGITANSLLEVDAIAYI
jgi:enamine deaminase RidA (YjgF/YER057c/UK114 family)